MTKKLIDRRMVGELLGVSDKTVVKMIEEDGLPMAMIGREWKGSEDDIFGWVRSRYPSRYRDMINRAPRSSISVRTRGQMSGEEFGIVENQDGKRRIVEGEDYIKFRFDRVVGKERLVSIQHRGTCSFEITKTGPML